ESLVAPRVGKQEKSEEAETEGAQNTPWRLLAPGTHPGRPRPCKTQPIFPPAQGDVRAQMRRIFYCRSKLAILLIGRRIATMSPQAVRREAALAARFRKLPVTAAANRPAKERAQPGEGQKREDHHRPTIRRNATGTVPLVGIGRKQRLRALMRAGPGHRVSSAAPYHIFTPCSAKYFSA